MIQHRKNLSLELLLPDSFFSAGASEAQSGAPAEASGSFTSGTRTRPTCRKARSGSTDVLDAMERQERRRPEHGANAAPPQCLIVDGRAALVSLTASGIEWAAAAPKPCATGPECRDSVQFSEMLSAQPCDPRTLGVLPCLRVKLYRLELFTFRRSPQRRCEWHPRRLVLEAPDEDTMQDWAASIGRGIEAAAGCRPRSLLVVVNPRSGYHQGRRLYRRIVAPVFAAAGIKLWVRETQHPGHASQMVAQLSAEQLRGIDGVVCVGGDGVFHEALNGLLQVRSAAAAAGAADLSDTLSTLRLAHIPAGSTDAVACTLHGTRGAFTAAMHICLGDSTPLDVLRVDTAAGTKFASCIAAYGFLGDVTAAAEGYRWLGPLRYDLVGAAKLLASRSYPARVRYLVGAVGRALHKHQHAVCAAECNVCRTASFLHSSRLSQQQMASGPGGGGSSQQASPAVLGHQTAPPGMAAAAPPGAAAGLASGASSPSCSSGSQSEPPSPSWPAAAGSSSAAGSPSPSPHFMLPAAGAAERQDGEQWLELEGEWCSIMLIVMPCRSDKTRAGMARFGHLADGRIKLVLVRKCSPLQYLRFLLNMSRHGCAPGQLPYVSVLDAVAVQVEPTAAGGGGGSRRSSGAQKLEVSCWNLDGELVRGEDMRMAAEVHHGLLRVFSRGVEQ